MADPGSLRADSTVRRSEKEESARRLDPGANEKGTVRRTHGIDLGQVFAELV